MGDNKYVRQGRILNTAALVIHLVKVCKIASISYAIILLFS